jgi:hypothetical protein
MKSEEINTGQRFKKSAIEIAQSKTGKVISLYELQTVLVLLISPCFFYPTKSYSDSSALSMGRL